MPDDPDAPPPSWDRRKLLLALGAGAVNVGMLYGIDVPDDPSTVGSGRVRAGRSPGDPAQDPGSASSEPVDPAAPAARRPTAEPPALPGADPAPDPSHVFDLVIVGGRVIDPGSGFDGLADVGIDGDRITAISAVPLRGFRRLDAAGRVVAPGFVDLLSAEPNPFGVWLKLADGVTTNLAMHGSTTTPRPSSIATATRRRSTTAAPSTITSCGASTSRPGSTSP